MAVDEEGSGEKEEEIKYERRHKRAARSRPQFNANRRPYERSRVSRSRHRATLCPGCCIHPPAPIPHPNRDMSFHHPAAALVKIPPPSCHRFIVKRIPYCFNFTTFSTGVYRYVSGAQRQPSHSNSRYIRQPNTTRRQDGTSGEGEHRCIGHDMTKRTDGDDDGDDGDRRATRQGEEPGKV